MRLPLPCPLDEGRGLHLFTGASECCAVALCASLGVLRKGGRVHLVDGAGIADPYLVARFAHLIGTDPAEVLRALRVRRVLTSLDAGRVVLEALEEASAARCVVVAGAARAVGGECSREGMRWPHRLVAALERVARKIPVVVAEPAAPSGPVADWIRAVRAMAQEVFEVGGGPEGIRVLWVREGKTVPLDLPHPIREALRWVTR